MDIKFNEVTLIDNYKDFNENVHFIKISPLFKSKSISVIKGDNSKYMISKLIMGFISPTFGTIDIGDLTLKRINKPSTVHEVRRKIGYLPYDFNNMFNYESVNNNLKELLYNYGYKTQEADKQCEKVLDMVGLYGDYKNAQIKDLNTINKYRLYLASILIHDPDIIILERFINDVEIKKLLQKLAHEQNKLIIIIGNYNNVGDKEYILGNNGIKEVPYEKE